jgi:hypothetical protein
MFRVFSSVVAASVALTGCATNSLSPKGDAVFYALQADAMMNTWRYECAAVSARANYAADAARADWWQRNKATVEAADFGLAYNLVAVTDTRLDTGARLAMSLTQEVQERAEQTVNKKLDEASDKEALCLEVLGQYQAGKWDIKGSDEIQGALWSLKASAERNKERYRQRKGMVDTAAGKQYGRSLYVVEKLSDQESCDREEVSLIKGEWPYEIYNVACEDKPLSIVRCEWGRCTFVE